MVNELNNIQLKHSNLSEDGWMQYLTKSWYIPQFLTFPSVATVNGVYCYMYKRQGAYDAAENKVENFIKVYNESNRSSSDEPKVAIVTGANTGIGYETARILVRAGFHVIIACRSKTKALEAIKRIEDNSEPIVEGKRGTTQFLELDLTSFQSVRNFAKAFLDLNLPLHYLINNAGVMFVPKFELTEDNHEMQFQVNHLSHFLLIEMLLPKLKETSGLTKVINLSSVGHYGAGLNLSDFSTLDDKSTYSPYTHYMKAKAANVMTTYKLHRLLKESNAYGGDNGVITYAVHPGGVNTELMRHSVSDDSYFHSFKDGLLKSPLQGALTTLRLVFLNPDQLLNDAKQAKSTDGSKFTLHEPKHHIYFSDELPITPLLSTLDEKSQDNLWELSKTMTGL